MTDRPAHALLLEPLVALARAAGREVMQVYASDFVVEGKADDSPVTLADRRAEAVILAGLSRLAPQLPVVAEEAASAGDVPAVGRRFWLVDPLDGTREFVQRNGEFTVNIALVEDGQPTLGVVWAPAVGRMFAGLSPPDGPAQAFEIDDQGRRAIRVRPVPAEGLTVLASRSHGDAQALGQWIEAQRTGGRPVARVMASGSSLKLCRIAAGEGDAYPRFGRTMEWDIAAGHAVLAAAGGRVLGLDGRPLAYGKPGHENASFVAWGDA